MSFINLFKRILLIGHTRQYYCLMCLSGPCQGSAVYRAKEVPSFLKYFKTLSMGPPSLGIEPTTSRFAVKRSFDVAYLAAATNTSTVSNTGSLVTGTLEYQQFHSFIQFLLLLACFRVMPVVALSPVSFFRQKLAARFAFF